MSLLQTIRTLEGASAPSRAGWAFQPFTAAVLTWLIPGGSGSVPDRRRHLLGESGLLCLNHIALSQLAPFGQLKTKGNGRTIGAPSTTERRERSNVKARFDGTRQRTRRPCAPLLEGTRQRTRRSCAHLQKIDTEKDAVGGSRQTLTTGSDVLLGNTWEQDQDACLPVYRPLENKTERQTVASARWEQGRRALITKRSKALPNPRSVPSSSNIESVMLPIPTLLRLSDS
jgi:hypothetical protein